MKVKLEAILKNKTFFLWSFRASACFLFLSVFPILFILIDVLNGSIFERFSYISNNYTLVVFAWSTTFVALIAICFNFSLLFFHLNDSYRPILQWAWFISVVALFASALYHLIQIIMVPSLMEWMFRTPFTSVSTTIATWDHTLSQLSGVFIPTSLSIGGLIYTAVMFQTKEIPLLLSYWSFGIWTAVLLGTLCVPYLGVLVFFFLSLAILLYVPWVWQIGDLKKNS